MLRTKNALSIVAQTIAATAAVSVVGAMAGYPIAFSAGRRGAESGGRGARHRGDAAREGDEEVPLRPALAFG